MLALQLLVAAADLAAAAHDAAGERQDDAGHLPDGRDRRLGRRQRRRPGCRPRIRKLPPATPLTVPKTVLADELAVHDRQPPVAPAFELLAELEAVAEEAQVAADADGLVLDDRQAVVAGRGRAGEDALADAVDDGLLQGVAAEGEQQQADAGPAVGRLVGGQRRARCRPRRRSR